MEHLRYLQEEVYGWASDDQWRCIQLLQVLFHGDHHLPGPVKRLGFGVCVLTNQQFSSFDSDYLTRSVLLAHAFFCRVSLGTRGMKLLIAVHPRRQFGSMFARHPSLSDLIELAKSYEEKSPQKQP